MIRPLPLRILAAGLALVLMLVELVVWESRARAAGREVLLPMEAVDPRDLLTGHYVALRLTQRLPPGQPCPDSVTTLRQGQWLGLREGRFVRIATTKDAALATGADLAMRGGAYCSRMAFGGAEGNAVTLDVGVDRFHADQQQAQAIEAALRARTPAGEGPAAFAVVSVGQDGRARLKGLIVGGKRTDLAWW